MSTDRATLDIPAAVLAFLFPGAGQMFRGQLYRGAMASVGVLGLFLSGLLIGGIDVIDSKEDPIWFFGQAIVGPGAFAVDALHQSQFKAWAKVPSITGRPTWDTRSGYPVETRTWIEPVPGAPDQPGKNKDILRRGHWEWRTPTDASATAGPPNKKSIAKMNELGTLFVTIAGMLNFIIILDALMPTKRSKPGRNALDKLDTPAGLAVDAAISVTSTGTGS